MKYYQDELITIFHGDCREILPSIRDISAVVTDPPYELGFFNKKWDSSGISYQCDTWGKIRESCKPGAMLLSFGGTRTFHRIAVAIEDAGWEVRDTIMWVYGQGFPKSHNISKSIDKVAGAEREIVGHIVRGDVELAKTSGFTMATADANKNNKSIFGYGVENITIPFTREAKLWNGYGTALKPAYEPILVCMNALDGTFADNAIKHGVAGINIDECRVDGAGGKKWETPRGGIWKTDADKKSMLIDNPKGRFPANLIHDGSDEVVGLFPQAGSGNNQEPYSYAGREYDNKDTSMFNGDKPQAPSNYNDTGSAARFFYCAKANRRERGEDNNHPTIKPLELMKYLCKLVKYPEYNIILDPFMGSGTTLVACKTLGIHVIGIDSDESSCEIAAKRCAQDKQKSMQFGI